ncbi:hypothetical protein D3C71_1497810 [compost metagenome]
MNTGNRGLDQLPHLLLGDAFGDLLGVYAVLPAGRLAVLCETHPDNHIRSGCILAADNPVDGVRVPHRFPGTINFRQPRCAVCGSFGRATLIPLIPQYVGEELIEGEQEEHGQKDPVQNPFSPSSQLAVLLL